MGCDSCDWESTKEVFSNMVEARAFQKLLGFLRCQRVSQQAGRVGFSAMGWSWRYGGNPIRFRWCSRRMRSIHSHPLITYSDEHFAPGPHSGHHPQDVNPKQGQYHSSCLSTGMQRHHPGPDMTNFYPLSPGGVGQITPPLGWFSHHMVPGPPGPHATGIPHPAIVNPQVKHEPQHDNDLMHMKPQHQDQRKEQEPKRPHIKKPLNAFMLYMKEMRANVVAECTLKESAAINQILGRRWHALSREEQAKYYELARKERQLHMQLYPGWSARDNYGKKKKRKREKIQEPAADPHRTPFDPSALTRVGFQNHHADAIFCRYRPENENGVHLSINGGKLNTFSTSCKAKAAAMGLLLEMEAC
ncbi:hypothetical protein J4Q44_G00040400 [Coregonus suidteri]|uniref:HMG box domain-containing protein n=1 Tax=Coregonus suidteri TaxID=861788 RepID=A0AAN8MDN2_9TELE